MLIKVYSKKEFKNILSSNNITSSNVETLKDIFFISILNTNEIPYFKDNLENVLVLQFDDLTYKIDNLKLFDRYQAKRIIDFVEKHKDKKKLFVSCNAGIARSGAVGVFINDILKQDYFEFKNLNKNILPNYYVYDVLKKVYGDI